MPVSVANTLLFMCLLSIISLILSFRFSFSMSQVFLGALKPYLFIFAKLNQFFEKSNKLKTNFIS